MTKVQAKALWFIKKASGDHAEEEKIKSNLLSDDPSVLEYDISNDVNLIAKIDVQTLHLKEFPQVCINFEQIFEGTLRCVDLYYVCNGCGQVYWVGKIKLYTQSI